MKYEFTRSMLNPRDGVDFWNRMLGLLNDRMHSRLPRRMYGHVTEDKDYQKKHPRWSSFSWQDVDGTYRLFIDNGGFDRDYRSGIENQFYIHLYIAKAFNLVIPKNGSATADDKGYQLTSLVSAEHFRDPISSVVLVNDGTQKLWSIIDADHLRYKPEGIPSKSKILRLQSSVNLYLFERGHSFHSPLHQKRPLYVYSDLVQTQIVGGSETDLLREVVYEGAENENRVVKTTFEPQNLQVIPIRKNKFDTLEIGISEIDGTQAKFLGRDSATVVTLCFRRRSFFV